MTTLATATATASAASRLLVLVVVVVVVVVRDGHGRHERVVRFEQAKQRLLEALQVSSV